MKVWEAKRGLLYRNGREIMVRRDYATTFEEGNAEVEWIARACNLLSEIEEGEEEINTGDSVPVTRIILGDQP